MNNKPSKISIEFDQAELAVFISALNIGATTAMMCNEKKVQQSLTNIINQLDIYKPECLNDFGKYQWFHIINKLYSAQTWSVSITQPDLWRRDKKIEITIDDNHKWLILRLSSYYQFLLLKRNPKS